MIIYLKIVKYLAVKVMDKLLFIWSIYKWREVNAHNQTFIANHFDFKLVSVGNYTYGDLKVLSYKNSKEKLIIGNFVSVANNVVFVLGGNHQLSTFTSFPLKAHFTKREFEKDAVTKGPIIIEDEVWLGYGAVILSGVTVGRGAVIAAGSIVTSDVPPFAIFGGNPAKLIRYKYTQEIIQKIRDVKLEQIPLQTLVNNIDVFYLPIDSSLEEIKSLKW